MNGKEKIMVQFKKIDKHSKELEKTRQLYLKAFPKEEPGLQQLQLNQNRYNNL